SETKSGAVLLRTRNPDCAALHPGYACCGFLLLAANRLACSLRPLCASRTGVRFLNMQNERSAMPREKPSNGLYLKSANMEGAAFGPIGIVALVAAFAFFGIGEMMLVRLPALSGLRRHR